MMSCVTVHCNALASSLCIDTVQSRHAVTSHVRAWQHWEMNKFHHANGSSAFPLVHWYKEKVTDKVSPKGKSKGTTGSTGTAGSTGNAAGTDSWANSSWGTDSWDQY